MLNSYTWVSTYFVWATYFGHVLYLRFRNSFIGYTEISSEIIHLNVGRCQVSKIQLAVNNLKMKMQYVRLIWSRNKHILILKTKEKGNNCNNQTENVI